MGDLYLWLKAGHVVSVIAWMAGIFYLPRLYVYHAEQAESVPQMIPVLEVMERRLLKAIMTPAMIATWVFGLAIVGQGGINWGAIWPWAKAACVIAMTVFHMWCGGERKRLLAGTMKTGRTYRMMNEVPTLLLIVIVIAVIVRPF